MHDLALTLLQLCLLGYLVGAIAGLLFLRANKLANLFAFGCGALAALCGVVSCGIFLATGAAAANQSSFEVFPSLIPYVRISARADPLGCFFCLIVSLVGLSLSTYSVGYARGFYGRKNVGVLGAFFNTLLLAT